MSKIKSEEARALWDDDTVDVAVGFAQHAHMHSHTDPACTVPKSRLCPLQALFEGKRVCMRLHASGKPCALAALKTPLPAPPPLSVRCAFLQAVTPLLPHAACALELGFLPSLTDWHVLLARPRRCTTTPSRPK